MLKLNRRGFNEYRQPSNRPNLHYDVRPKKDSKSCVAEIVKYIKNSRFRQSGIIYTLSKNDADDLSQKLRDDGIRARAYHGAKSASEKDKTLGDWMRDEVHVVVATIAFGLGINKAGVRFVIHHTLSKSLEGYYQVS